MLPAMPENSATTLPKLTTTSRIMHDEGDTQAELFADEIGEAFAGDGAHARAHLLDDDEGDGDGDHRPQQCVTELGACLGVGEGCHRRRYRRWR